MENCYTNKVLSSFIDSHIDSFNDSFIYQMYTQHSIVVGIALSLVGRRVNEIAFFHSFSFLNLTFLLFENFIHVYNMYAFCLPFIPSPSEPLSPYYPVQVSRILFC